MNAKLKIITLFILLISACQKDQLESDNQQVGEPLTVVLTKNEAMDFVAKLALDSNKILSEIKVNWDLAKNEATKEGNKWTVILDGQPTYQNYKQGYRQLVVLKDRKSHKIGEQ